MEVETMMTDYTDIWTLSEIKDGKLHPVSYELLAWGKNLAEKRGSNLCAVVLCSQLMDEEMDNLIQHGADVVYVVRHALLQNFLVESHSKVLQHLVETYKPEVFLAAATTQGRTVMPYLSMKLHTGLTADCTGLDIDAENGNLLQTRPAIGGNIMATIKTPLARPQMATVRPKSASPLARKDGRKGRIIEVEVPEECFTSRMIYEQFIPDELQEMAIEDAEVIVAGGSGCKSGENFKLLNELAKKLGGTLGASRPVIDRGWQPYSKQIGLSGKTVSPELYIACGISGAIQHLAGIQTAKHIIAINSDPNAQIFNVADLGIVGDMFEVIPEIVKMLEAD